MHARVLKNDKMDFEIETIPDERKVSVSSRVVGKAITLGVSLEVDGKVRVIYSADTDTVDRIMDDE